MSMTKVRRIRNKNIGIGWKMLDLKTFGEQSWRTEAVLSGLGKSSEVMFFNMANFQSVADSTGTNIIQTTSKSLWPDIPGKSTSYIRSNSKRRWARRSRYFTDSGIIGSKEFVSTNYQRFKHLFFSKHEKKPKPIKGLDGMYSLKRLSEMI